VKASSTSRGNKGPRRPRTRRWGCEDRFVRALSISPGVISFVYGDHPWAKRGIDRRPSKKLAIHYNVHREKADSSGSYLVLCLEGLSVCRQDRSANLPPLNSSGGQSTAEAAFAADAWRAAGSSTALSGALVNGGSVLSKPHRACLRIFCSRLFFARRLLEIRCGVEFLTADKFNICRVLGTSKLEKYVTMDMGLECKRKINKITKRTNTTVNRTVRGEQCRQLAVTFVKPKQFESEYARD